jgi:hypothetical protein
MKTIDGQYYRRDSGLQVMVFTTTEKYFSYIVAVSFNGRGNRGKPPTCRNSLTNYQEYWYVYSSPPLILGNTISREFNKGETYF